MTHDFGGALGLVRLQTGKPELRKSKLHTPFSKRKGMPHRSVSNGDPKAGVIIKISIQEANTHNLSQLLGAVFSNSPRDFGFRMSDVRFNENDGAKIELEERDNKVSSKGTDRSRIGDSKQGRTIEDVSIEDRTCISCGASKTPYWREAWNPYVLLCNACGLRYSKFKRHCLVCSYVPRKEDKGRRRCSQCGGAWS